jgi:hypothetical protein
MLERSAMQLKSNALLKPIEAPKPTISPVSRCFLVALFAFGLTSTYFDDLRSKIQPQHAASPDVENHQPKPAIVRVCAASPMDRAETKWLQYKRGLGPITYRVSASAKVVATEDVSRH